MLELTPDQLAFVTERHLATLTTRRADGSPHVVPVAFTWDAEHGRARITTRGSSVKVRNVEAAESADLEASGATRPVPASGTRVALCQVDGRRWLTLEGRLSVSRDADDVAAAVAAYAGRYRQLEYSAERVVLHLDVDRVMGSVR